MALVLDDIEKKISRQILYLYSVVSSSWKDIRRREAKKRERERENAKKEEDDEMDVSRKKNACVRSTALLYTHDLWCAMREWNRW